MPESSEFEGLKTSAVAVALTLFERLPQMREKKVGRLERVSWTVTIGFTPKAVALRELQSAELVPFEEYRTLGVDGAVPAMRF